MVDRKDRIDVFGHRRRRKSAQRAGRSCDGRNAGDVVGYSSERPAEDSSWTVRTRQLDDDLSKAKLITVDRKASGLP